MARYAEAVKAINDDVQVVLRMDRDLNWTVIVKGMRDAELAEAIETGIQQEVTDATQDLLRRGDYGPSRGSRYGYVFGEITRQQGAEITRPFPTPEDTGTQEVF